MVDEAEELRDDSSEIRSHDRVSAGLAHPSGLADRIGGKLLSLRAGIDQVRRAAPIEELALQHAVRELSETFGVVWDEMFRLLTLPARESANLVSQLTRREKEVAELVAQGHSNREIARRLYISEPTVKTHVSRTLRKLGVGQRAEITALVRSASKRVGWTTSRETVDNSGQGLDGPPER